MMLNKKYGLSVSSKIETDLKNLVSNPALESILNFELNPLLSMSLYHGLDWVKLT